MITGDKTETAVSVSRNSGLIKKTNKVIELDENNYFDFKEANEKFSVVCPGRIFRKIMRLNSS